MTSGDKAQTVVAVIVGAVLLWLFWHRAAAVASGSPSDFSFPPLPSPAPPPAPINYVINFPPAVNGVTNCPASCSCNGSSGLFSSLEAMLNAEAGKLANVEESYFAFIMGNLPTWFTQNLNNAEGAYLSNTSKSGFLNFG